MDCPNCKHDMHNSFSGGWGDDRGDLDESFCRKCGFTIYWNWDLDDDENIDWPDGIMAYLYLDGVTWLYAALPSDYEPLPWLICECGFERLADYNDDYTQVIRAECFSCDSVWIPESVQPIE